jgi:hypothetical protein
MSIPAVVPIQREFSQSSSDMKVAELLRVLARE